MKITCACGIDITASVMALDDDSWFSLVQARRARGCSEAKRAGLERAREAKKIKRMERTIV